MNANVDEDRTTRQSKLSPDVQHELFRIPDFSLGRVLAHYELQKHEN